MRHFLPVLLLALTALTLWPAHAQEVAKPGSAAAVGGQIEWRSLSTAQRTALAPLERDWASLGSDQQRKWIALTQNFSRMTPQERATLQGRMTEWANLTPAQRTQARLNFGEVRKVPADEKRAKWEEYQALPEEERARLASERPKPPAGAAPALRPVPAERLVRPSKPPVAGATPETRTGIPAPPQVNRHTLLPERHEPDAADADTH
ncbi:MAG TPA: DUF3106 domain-containing protein [Ottowia sp.]|nr:DUF3106 domain-containing protein [Ottowia sp.]